MPIDTRDYMHRPDCQCPICLWHKQHEPHAGRKLSDKEWAKLINIAKRNKK